MNSRVRGIPGGDADGLLKHECKTVSREMLHLPGPTCVDDVFAASDRSIRST